MDLSPEEFKKLFEANFAPLRNYLFFRSGDTELATDIAQDTFLKLWEKQPLLNPKTVKGLLYKIANDLFITHYRKQQRSFQFFSAYRFNGTAHSPADEMEFNELKKSFEKALERMPEKQRTVYLMSRVDHLKYSEIALMTGISVKAVEKRMNKALAFLQANLNTNEG